MRILSLLAASMGMALTSHVGWGNHADSPMNLEPRVFLARDSAGWKEFRNKFGHLRQFRNPTEEEVHARIFQDSEALVKAQNDKYTRQQSGFLMELNRFADMSESEYRARLHPISQNDISEFQRSGMPFVKTNDTYDNDWFRVVNWRRFTPTVKDQGSSGSFYAFAAVDALEVATAQKTGVQCRLSEQDIVDCSRPQGNNGCNGGNMAKAFNYIKDAGINLAANYPYQGVAGACRHNSSHSVKDLKDYVHFGWPNGDEQALQEALSRVGPITIGINAPPRSFMLYSWGTYDDPTCDPNGINHAMVLVARGTFNNNPVYMIKNSWGTGWGDGGYIRMAGFKSICGIGRMCSYPVLK